MSIKAVSKERIDQALQAFDRDFRGRREWLGWEGNRAHRYAIQVGDALYPAKKIVSLATGTPVSDFSGGHPTNSYLRKRGFVVVELAGVAKLFGLLSFHPEKTTYQILCRTLCRPKSNNVVLLETLSILSHLSTR
ncbi:hypothetical protein ACQKPE_01300 [Pseudomonas sp. NPDC089554]|uniref:hypothetical protein n=1 Tax=Pseudomonas sp. NPDC089554 TaxID=3390653 RepID=UPI003D05DE0E